MPSAARVTKPRPKTPDRLPPAVPPFPVRRFTVDEYHRLVEAGIIHSGEPYELIHGWIVRKMGINPPHSYALNALMELIGNLKGTGNTTHIQQPITTSDSEPEPDVVLAIGSNRDYAKRHPAPRDVLVLVEVADSSLSFDQTTKLQLYAQAKITEYWIVNLVDHRVEVYTQPRGGKTPGYKQQVNYGPNEEEPLVIRGLEVGRIPVRELLPDL